MRDDFHAGFLELFLHETFRRIGFRLTPHPDMLGTSKRPDFLVEKGAVRFYLEAKVARDISAEEEARERTRNLIYDAINEVPSPGHFVRIKRLELHGDQTPSLTALKSFLAAQLALQAPPPDDALPDVYDVDGSVTLEYRSDKLVADFALIPRSPRSRERSDARTIGIYPFQTRMGGTKDAIRSSVKRKGSRYARLDLPYVVAVNCVSAWGVDEDDILDALFGSEQIVVSPVLETAVPSRARDGAWIGPTKPILTRVSAALVASIYPWSLSAPRCTLVHNPWAAKPLPEFEHPLVTGRVVGAQVVWSDGRDLLRFFDLPRPWPEAG